MAISFEKMGQQVWVQEPSWPVWTFTCMRFVCWAWINDFLVMDLHLWCQVPITGWMGQRLCATVKDPREIINNLACVILCSHSNLRGRMFWVRTGETKRHWVRRPQLLSKCWRRKAGCKRQLSSEVSPSWPSPHSLLCAQAGAHCLFAGTGFAQLRGHCDSPCRSQELCEGKVQPCPSAAFTGAVRKWPFILVVEFLSQVTNELQAGQLEGNNVIKKNHYTEEILV